MRRDRPGRRAVIGSIGLHIVVVSVALAGGLRFGKDEPEFRVYRVNIVSPPPAQAARPPEPQRQPEPEPPRPESEPTPEPTRPEPQRQPPRPDPRPQAQRPPEPEPPRQQEPEPPPPEPEPQPAREEPRREEPQPQPRPAETERRRSGEGLNVQLTGEEFPFPEYLENVVRQIHRYFRWTGTQRLEAEVYFTIRRDGGVEDIRLIRGSGDVAFNFEAMGAVEQAGIRRAFGPLPHGFQGDRLPVSFYFRPQR